MYWDAYGRIKRNQRQVKVIETPTNTLRGSLAGHTV